MVGIPLCLLAIVAVSEWLQALTHWVERHVHRRQSTTVASDRRCDRFVGVLRSVMMACLGIVIFILLPSIGFTHAQNWDYSTAVYYSVVSLSTIGFGDYVAGA